MKKNLHPILNKFKFDLTAGSFSKINDIITLLVETSAQFKNAEVPNSLKSRKF